MVQRVKDPDLSLEQLGSLLWSRFDPWPKKFHGPWMQPKKKKKRRRGRRRRRGGRGRQRKGKKGFRAIDFGVNMTGKH